MPLRSDPAGVFDSDLHRRILGNLGAARTLPKLIELLVADPNWYSGEPQPPQNLIPPALDELVRVGLATSLGMVDDHVAAQQEEPGVPNLPDEKAELEAERGYRIAGVYSDNELYVTTDEGREKLRGPIAVEPPPVGA